MEEVKNINPDQRFKKSFEDPRNKKDQKPIANLTAEKINHEAVKVALESKGRAEPSTHREKINSVIQQVNLAVQTTEEIRSLFDGISGIIEQANQQTVTRDRLLRLEREAQELAAAFKEIAQKGSDLPEDEGIDDGSLAEIENKLNQVLGQLSVDQSGNIITPADISFKDPEAISSTSTKVRSTMEYLESISRTIHQTTDEIRRAIELGEVAVENSDAAETMVRDVDQALERAHQACLKINTDPNKALSAVGPVKLRPDLLKP